MTKNSAKLDIDTRLPSFRASKKLTQQQLGEAIGVTRATIIAIENTGYNPSLDLAFRIARFFGVTIEDIFFLKHEGDVNAK